MTPTPSPSVTALPGEASGSEAPGNPATEVGPDHPAGLQLEVEASPEIARPGGIIRIAVNLTNPSIDPLMNVRFEDILESGMNLVPGESAGVSYDPKSRAVSGSIAELPAGQSQSFKYAVRVSLQPSASHPQGELWTHRIGASVEELPIEPVEVALWVGAPGVLAAGRLGQLGRTGGTVRTELASITLEPGSLGSDVAVVVSAVKRPGGPERQFNIELLRLRPAVLPGSPGETRSIVGTAADATFSRPARLTVPFAAVADLQQAIPGQEPFVVTFDEEEGVWVKVPILAVDYDDNSVDVLASHFSTWGAGLGDSLPQNGANVLLFDEPYTSLFTGQARFSYPIWTPPGRAGMTPSVTLSYSSGTANGLLGDIQAPWVGMGWSIDQIEIVRKITTDENGYGYENEFALTLNGVRHELIQDSTSPARYHTKNASFLYIERHSPALINFGTGITNQTHEWWEVVAKDGTRHYLGRTKDSEQRALMDGYSCTQGTPCTTPNGAYASLGYAGEGADFVAIRWRVDRIIDTHGNFIDFTYLEEGEQPHFPDFDKASYPDTISYTGRLDGQGVVDVDPAYSVHFVTEARTADNPAQDLEVWDHVDSRFLGRIDVCYGDCATPVRSYDLEYAARQVPSADGTLVLTGITAASAGFTDLSAGVSIPAASAPEVRFEYSDFPNWKEDCVSCEKWRYPRISAIHNGFGATLEYTYERDNRGSNYWYNWRGVRAEVDGGLGVASIQGYSYEGAVYEGVGGDPIAGALVGYSYVISTSYDFDGSTPIAAERHNFGTAEPDIGRPLSAEWRNGAGTNLLRTVNTWITDNSTLPAGVTFRYLGYENRYELIDGALQLASKSRFVRDPATGNLTDQRTYLGGTLLRRQNYEYRLNFDPGTWILDRVSRQTLHDRYDRPMGDVRYFYDTGSPSLTVGELHLVQSVIGPSGQTADVRYQYDEFGNLVEACVYKAYGSIGGERSGTCSGDDQRTGTTYDSSLHTYPVSLENALGYRTTMDYVVGLGLPWRVEDANGFVSATDYDGLGRVLSTTAPGFESPTTTYTYPTPVNGQVDAPYATQVQILDTLGPGGGDSYRSAWAIYDGLGRLLQAQTRDDDTGKLILTDTAFDAAGLAFRQSAPRSSGAGGGSYVAPSWGSILHSTTTYDALGRPTLIEDPAGHETRLLYDGLTTETIDPNGHKIARQADGLGRMVLVREYTGADPDWALYASTSYGYDAADRLITVRDADGNLTEITNDWLGRKTSMHDPDMGSWTYEYDPIGNLTEQTDGLSQTLAFGYDRLNRLILRREVGGQADLATFGYGTQPGEIGLRTQMIDASGTTTWSYTNFGRATVETRDISAASSDYAFRTERDWLGRVASVTYPDGEVVTYDYDALGRASDLSASMAGELLSLAYNVQGQITRTDLANGLVLQNCYESDTFRLASRRAYPGAVQSCAIVSPQEALINFSYTYDPGGNITALEDLAQGESFDFDYDPLNRLTAAEGTGATDIAFRHEYRYDQIGNILQMSTWNHDRAAPGLYEEDYPGFWLSGDWEIVADEGASDDVFTRSNDPGAFARLAFGGAGFNYIRPIGPDQGIAGVYIDGALAGEVDNYNAEAIQQVAVAFAFPSGDHLLEVRVTGGKNPQSSGSMIGLDSIEVLATGPTPTATLTPTETDVPTITPTPTDTPVPTETPTPTETVNPAPTSTLASAPAGIYEESSGYIAFVGDWEVHDDGGYSGGHAKIADALGEIVYFRFVGSRFTYYRYRGPNQGIVEVCIDGMEPSNCTDLDNYSGAAAYVQAAPYDVGYGDHSVTLSYSGRKHPDATGFLISLDKVSLEDFATPTPTATYTASPTPTGTPVYGNVVIGPSVLWKSGSNYTISETYTVDSGDNRVLVFGLGHAAHNGQALGTPTYNDVPMTLAGSCYADGDFSNVLYYLPNPPVGTHTVHFGFNKTARYTFGVLTLYNVDLEDLLGETVCQRGTGTRSVLVDTLPGDMVVDNFHQAYRKTVTVGEGQTQHWNTKTETSTWSMRAAASSEASTGYEVTMSFSSTYSYPTAYIVTVFQALQHPEATETPTPTATRGAWPTPIGQDAQPAGTYENTNSAWHYALPWTEVASSGDSGGTRHVSQDFLAVAQLTFTGNRLDYFYRMGPSYGVADVVLDGAKLASIDLYNSTELAAQLLSVDLRDGAHLLEIRHAGRKNPASSGDTINLDKVVVLAQATPTPTYRPTTTSTWTATPTPTSTQVYRSILVGSNVLAVNRSGYYVNEPYEVFEGEDRLLVLALSHGAHNGQSLGTPQYAGLPMTLARSCYVDGDFSSVMYYLPNPPTGLRSLVLWFNHTARMTFGLLMLYNVDLDNPLGETTCQQSGGDQSATMNAQPGDLAIDLLHQNDGYPVTVGPEQTQYWHLRQESGDSWRMRSATSSEVATGPQVTMSYEAAYQTSYIVAVFRALQAPLVTPTPSITPTSTATATAAPAWSAAYYAYEAAHPHAVVSVKRSGGTDAFGYDDAGNMTSRLETGVDWTQEFNVENRLSSISDGAEAWRFSYDGDGVRVHRDNPDGSKTLFLGGGAYEVTLDFQGQETSVKRYYALASQRVLRDGDGLHFLLTDHLGSVVAVADEAGALESEQRYLPFGLPRLSPGLGGTDFSFTGQLGLEATGLMDYNARWYAPSIGRFVSPDSVVPEIARSVGLNRYAYVSNNPIMHSDPTGHCVGVLAGLDTLACVGLAVGVAYVAVGALYIYDHYYAEHVAEALEDLMTSFPTQSAPPAQPVNPGIPSNSPIEDNPVLAGPTLGQAATSADTTTSFPLESPNSQLLGFPLEEGIRANNFISAWKVGDPIDAPTRAGYPSWSTARRRYWMNEAASADPGRTAAANLERMTEGKPPLDPITGAGRELHHINGRHVPNPHHISNLVKLWPWQHARIDPYRRYNGPVAE